MAADHSPLRSQTREMTERRIGKERGLVVAALALSASEERNGDDDEAWGGGVRLDGGLKREDRLCEMAPEQAGDTSDALKLEETDELTELCLAGAERDGAGEIRRCERALTTENCLGIPEPKEFGIELHTFTAVPAARETAGCDASQAGGADGDGGECFQRTFAATTV